DEDPEEHAKRLNKLKFLLQRSSIYSRIMGEKMAKERAARAAAAEREHQSGETQGKERAAADVPVRTSTRTAGAVARRETTEADREKREKNRQHATESRRKRQGVSSKLRVSEYLDEEDLAAAAAAAEAQDEHKKSKPQCQGSNKRNTKNTAAMTENMNDRSRLQPALITGARMRDYQIDGLQWLISLYENGLNGILADEMGLGKTLQTISFLAHLRSKRVWGPFLIVAPLSTIDNWVLEFERFAPDIPVGLYYGTTDERKDIRQSRLRMPTSSSAIHDQKRQEEEDAFPVVVTTYEIVIRDRSLLANIPWKYIVVDEGHRLKNMNCRLIRELKQYRSANRLILTGTPLHNNLAELWSLLNFILPDIFDDLETFEKWFDFSDMHDDQGSQKIFRKRTGVSQSAATTIITQLHEILKPFLLRRLKSDVEGNLPPKKEYLLYAPLTEMQKELYDAVLNKDIRRWLMERKTGLSMYEIEKVLEDAAPFEGGTSALNTPSLARTPAGSTPAEGTTPATEVSAFDLSSSAPASRAMTPRSGTAGRRAKHNKQYTDPSEGDAYAQAARSPLALSPAECSQQGKLYTIKQARKEINNMHLENMVMQLRKICCHPYLFDWPRDPDSGLPVTDEDLIHASGKMLLLNRLLDALFAKGHKVLVFSQFTTMLDVIEDWADVYKGLRTCRIDGNTHREDRRSQMKSFNTETGPDACNLFLLSTRAGGLGINLVAADTVIFYDSDWNPQMDLQAQDRVHRIGQTKPVLIFRLVSANTVEQRVLKRASNKRKLEALVIQQGKFRLPAGYEAAAQSLVGGNGGAGGGRRQRSEEEELAADLLRLEGEKVVLAGKDDEIISDHDLEVLLDRSESAYARQLGWDSRMAGAKDSRGARTSESSSRSSKQERIPAAAAVDAATVTQRAMFEVTETQTDHANEDFARMLA
ncbi:hypothetical protein K437DRAFT_208624, partial [Tilletiaria anomala UBC 951]